MVNDILLYFYDRKIYSEFKTTLKYLLLYVWSAHTHPAPIVHQIDFHSSIFILIFLSFSPCACAMQLPFHNEESIPFLIHIWHISLQRYIPRFTFDILWLLFSQMFSLFSAHFQYDSGTNGITFERPNMELLWRVTDLVKKFIIAGKIIWKW